MKRAALLFAFSLLACDPPLNASGSTDAGASPQASILPAPLATGAPELDAGGDAGPEGIPSDKLGEKSDAGVGTPEPLRTDLALVPEAWVNRDMSGVMMEGAWRWQNVPPPPKAPEVSIEGEKEAQKLSALTWKIDLAEPGRLRLEFTSQALPLPMRSEIRQRADRWGSIILWPNGTDYRVVPAGALRTVMGERRVDVTPLSAGTTRAQGEGRRLGYATKKIEIVSTLGSVKLELAKVPEAGEGATCWCRVLLELGGIDPKSSVCVAGELPLYATYWWQGGGGVAFEVTSLVKHGDLAPSSFLMPPPGPNFASSGLPEVPQMIFFTREQLVALRTTALAGPPIRDPNIPGEGFVAVNKSDELMYLLVDGSPVVAVPPASDRYVIGPPRGKYVIEWRTFLGEHVGAPQSVEIPGRFTYGATIGDAGAPDGG